MKFLVFAALLSGIVSTAQEMLNEKVFLNSNNALVLRGEITDESISAASVKLSKLVRIRSGANYPIYIVLDSPGGELESGKSFIEFTKVIPNVRTITIFAASMAAMTVESLPGSRLITNNGILMFHRARGGFEGQFEVGELETRLAIAKNEMLSLEKVVAARLGIAIDVYKAKIKDEFWITADSAIQQRAADKVVDIVCSEELVKGRTKVTYSSIFGSIDLKFSNCPTIRGPVIF